MGLAMADKKKYKCTWAQNKYAKVEEKQVFHEGYNEVDETMGEYVTFGAYVVALGGWSWPDSILGAKRAVAKCAGMGANG